MIQKQYLYQNQNRNNPRNCALNRDQNPAEILMSKPFFLPFNFQINAPLSKGLKKVNEQIIHNKQIIFVITKLARKRMKNALKLVYNHTKSPLNIISKNNKNKNGKIQDKNNRMKFRIFNIRLKTIKSDVFCHIRMFSLRLKTQQNQTILQNRQNQLLNYLMPKLQQKIQIYAFRKIFTYSNQNKSKNKIVTELQKCVQNIIKRQFYIDFFNRLKRQSNKKQKKTLFIKKMFRILSCSVRMSVQQSFQQIFLYTKCIDLQQLMSQKKSMLSKLSSSNTQRVQILQKQRQHLRYLKHQIDHQSVQKSHSITQKKRNLNLFKLKTHQQEKILNQSIRQRKVQTNKLENILVKENRLVKRLKEDRNRVVMAMDLGINFQAIVVDLGKDLKQMDNLILIKDLVQLIAHFQHHYQDVLSQIGLTYNQIQQDQTFLCRKITLLQRLVRAYEKKSNLSSLNSSFHNSLSTSTILPTTKSIKQSRINLIRSKQTQNIQIIRLKQEYKGIYQIIGVILEKMYQFGEKLRLQEDIDGLDRLLQQDLMDYQ